MGALCSHAKNYFQEGQEALAAGNYAQAFADFEAGAKDGDSDCCAKLGAMYFGLGVQMDLSKARYWAQRGIESDPGNPRGYMVMGMSFVYDCDINTGKGAERGLPYHIKAYELKGNDANYQEDYINCAIQIATIYWSQGDRENEKLWLDRLVEDFPNSAEGLGMAGYMYLDLDEYDNAVRCATVADRKDNVYAAYVLGYCLAYGKGISTNQESAFKYMKKAALAGIPGGDPEYAFGTFYEFGIGTPKDINKAKYWYQLSSQQNNQSAIERLNILQ